MPFDGTKPRVFDQLIAFAASKAPDDEYDWDSPSFCVIGAWAQTTGLCLEHQNPYLQGLEAIRNAHGGTVVQSAVDACFARPWTYGAATARLRMVSPSVVEVANAV